MLISADFPISTSRYLQQPFESLINFWYEQELYMVPYVSTLRKAGRTSDAALYDAGLPYDCSATLCNFLRHFATRVVWCCVGLLLRNLYESNMSEVSFVEAWLPKQWILYFGVAEYPRIICGSGSSWIAADLSIPRKILVRWYHWAHSNTQGTPCPLCTQYTHTVTMHVV